MASSLDPPRCFRPKPKLVIRTLKEGGTLIKPVITERILRGLEQARPDFPSLNPPDPLTERETEVLRLMVAGYSNREIADAIRVSEGTVKNHVSSILSKLGVGDRTRAVLKAPELGFI
jgi:DNA-binding NarL/FixJ family response regulator